MVAPATLAVPHHPTPAAELDRARFGLVIYLTSKAMFFVALIGAYLVLSQTQSWPPPGTKALSAARALPATALLLLSGATALVAPIAIRKGRLEAARIGVAVTFMLGAIFVGVQVAEWFDLYADGLRGTSYAQFFYVLTGFHLLYIVTGLAMFAVVIVRARAGRYDAERHVGIDLSTLWWHFCGAVWLVLFGAIYLYPELLR